MKGKQLFPIGSGPLQARGEPAGNVVSSALRSALLVIGGYIVLLWATQGLLRAFGSNAKTVSRDVFAFVVVQCVVCLWAVLGVGVYGLRGRRLLCPRRWSWHEMRRSVGLYLLSAPVIYAATVGNGYLVQHFLHQEPRQRIVQQILDESHPAAAGMLIVFGVLIAPVTEEVLFRGFLQKLMRPLCGPTLAICAVAASFSAAHADVVVIAPVFVLGLLLGWLYERTEHIGVPIAVHALHNALTIAVIFSLGVGR